MAKCRNCGNEIGDDVSVCPYCREPDPLNKGLKPDDSVDYFKKPRKYATDAPITGNNGNSKTERDGGTAYAILGFIFSFMVPVFGLPFSIAGFNRSKNNVYPMNTRFSIAGIIISILDIIVWIVMLIIYFV